MSNNKPLWQTKSFWVGVVTIAAGLVEGLFVTGEFAFSLPALLNEKVLLGLAIITGRHAVKKLESGG